MDYQQNNTVFDQEQQQIYQAVVDSRAPELFCDSCGHYPIEPVHGHFVCPACKMPTKCCEGMGIDV